jgi:hypothetical protein
MRTYILPYVANSMAAKALAERLEVKRLRATERSPVLREEDFVINWGKSGEGYVHPGQRVMNKPSVLRHITHKLRFFQRMREVMSPYTMPWTTSAHAVRRWLAEGEKVMARTKLTSHSGKGIVVMEGRDAEMVDAPLYTKYLEQDTEYRVHFIRTGNGEVRFQTQMKRKGKGRGEVMASEIQNHKNGYIYVINDVTYLPEVEWDRLRKEIDRVFYDLDFGAVDVLLDKKGDYYILEVNTAPGLKSPTLLNFYEESMDMRMVYEEEGV